jgi:hypothetical protein
LACAPRKIQGSVSRHHARCALTLLSVTKAGYVEKPRKPGCVGEAGVAAAVPALGNAIFVRPALSRFNQA